MVNNMFIRPPPRSNNSVYITYKHKLPTVQKTWELYEFRNLGLAVKNKKLFYNHHGGFEYVQVL